MSYLTYGLHISVRYSRANLKIKHSQKIYLYFFTYIYFSWFNFSY